MISFLRILLISIAFQASAQADYQRIITLSPHLTEMVYSAGAGNKLVGVVDYSDYPQAALKLPIIGSYNALNFEKIIALKPDLILTWRSGNRLQDFERLQRLQSKLGYQLYETEIESLQNIPELISQIGKLAGTEVSATAKAQELQNELQNLRQQYQGKPPISVFYQIWNRPLITMGDKQFISQGIELCGGRNIFKDLGSLTGQIALETVVLRNPQVILLGGDQAMQDDWQKAWLRYPQLQAVKNQQIYKMDNNRYQRPTERFIKALSPLCHLLDQARKDL